jgi:hypothetical protein
MVNVQTVQVTEAIEAVKRDLRAEFATAITDLEAKYMNHMHSLEQQVQKLTSELVSKTKQIKESLKCQLLAKLKRPVLQFLSQSIRTIGYGAVLRQTLN